MRVGLPSPAIEEHPKADQLRCEQEYTTQILRVREEKVSEVRHITRDSRVLASVAEQLYPIESNYV